MDKALSVLLCMTIGAAVWLAGMFMRDMIIAGVGCCIVVNTIIVYNRPVTPSPHYRLIVLLSVLDIIIIWLFTALPT